MAIPVYLQQFKAAGIYRVVFDKSTLAGVDAEILRLVVGYSEKGPFNIPTYITSTSDFIEMYGNISTKLEKRGIYFHRIALQALTAGPILVLNLKKFANETVTASTISTEFNPKDANTIIKTAKLNVEDVYDTSRFWELSAEKLDDLQTKDPTIKLSNYINIAVTNDKSTSVSYIIRKTPSVSGYDITLNDWYKSSNEDLPEYLIGKENTLVSDYFADIYVFKGKFTDDVLVSENLKKYFEKRDGKIVLVKSLQNAYGDNIDPLEQLYQETEASPLGMYSGVTLPYFKDKQGRYICLDVAFNTDQSLHNCMMSLNTDKLDDGINIDLSGKENISSTMLTALKAHTLKVNVLGNKDIPVQTASVAVEYTNPSITSSIPTLTPVIPTAVKDNTIEGQFILTGEKPTAAGDVTLTDVNDTTKTVVITLKQPDLTKINWDDIKGTTTKGATTYISKITGLSYATSKYSFSDSSIVTYKATTDLKGLFFLTSTIPTTPGDVTLTDMNDTSKTITLTLVTEDLAKINWNDIKGTTTEGAEKYLIQLTNLSCINKKYKLTDVSSLMYGDRVSSYVTKVTNAVDDAKNFIYDPSILTFETDYTVEGNTLKGTNTKLSGFLRSGDAILGEKAMDDSFYPLVYVQSIDTVEDQQIITFTGKPFKDENGPESKAVVYIIEKSLGIENGVEEPIYLEGYTFESSKPVNTGMRAKLDWQDNILKTLTEYKGLRVGLLSKADIDYRYIIDTFESYVDSGCKDVLSLLAKDKQSAFAILNFPSIKTFVKCPYTSFTDDKGRFNVQYVVDGFNKKKGGSMKFSLPDDGNGASFCAFYSPLKFSDGYLDTYVPSAGLVSNLFMEKYKSRYPYYIIAGPNYGSISASGLVGPDYNYSQDELNIIEPFGVNCMVYRPTVGTFINANQTAKQTPVSALSKVHVRELVIYLQDEIEKILQQYQWEFNNDVTRNAILTRANQICENVLQRGGLQYYVNTMDSSNNTTDIIDNEMAIISTAIEPGMGAGKMVQELTIYRTGQISSTIK